MSVSQRMRVPFGDVFPEGAYMVGEVEPVEHYELIKAAKAAGRDPGDVQLRDKVTEKRVWSVRVIDADPLARRGKVRGGCQDLGRPTTSTAGADPRHAFPAGRVR